MCEGEESDAFARDCSFRTVAQFLVVADFARLSEESFARLAFQYSRSTEEIRRILAYSELLGRNRKRLDGGETRQRFGVLDECNQIA